MPETLIDQRYNLLGERRANLILQTELTKRQLQAHIIRLLLHEPTIGLLCSLNIPDILKLTAQPRSLFRNGLIDPLPNAFIDLFELLIEGWDVGHVQLLLFVFYQLLEGVLGCGHEEIVDLRIELVFGFGGDPGERVCLAQHIGVFVLADLHDSFFHSFLEYPILPGHIKIIQKLLLPPINIRSFGHCQSIDVFLLLNEIQLFPESIGILHCDALKIEADLLSELVHGLDVEWGWGLNGRRFDQVFGGDLFLGLGNWLRQVDF